MSFPVITVARLTGDAVVKTQTDRSVLMEFNIVRDRRVKRGDVWVDEPTFITAKYWLPKESKRGSFLTKGRQIFIQGEIIQENWVDQTTNQKRNRLVFEVRDFDLVGNAPSAGGAAPAGNAPAGNAPAADASKPAPAKMPENNLPEIDINEDEIPF